MADGRIVRCTGSPLIQPISSMPDKRPSAVMREHLAWVAHSVRKFDPRVRYWH